eukprot:TRINITY_DN111533_c0_g1_i1.p1 TRINITY_DN111533_c0_g1~~TRINITY_DN111533_c0_g1_i1.p1  ORF type:complete len:437 (+),score=111.80 TRINITY_DN111533_c0_g1_i1:107-1312(+)
MVDGGSASDAANAGEEAPAVDMSKAVPLLKFEGKDERPVLCQEGLDLISMLPGPVMPVAFVGDGRSGKSYLASKVIGREEAFATDDSCEAVTEGIDIAVVYSHPGHILVMDCEGGNNAMSASHSIVTVVGALIATCLAFVTDGKASEAAIEALARMLEERSLIKCDGTGSLHAQHLLFIVNQNRLKYGDDALEKILAANHGIERREVRGLIADAYPEDRRQFFTVPSDGKKEFDNHWQKLHEAVMEAATPLKMGRLWMTGSQVNDMLRQIHLELLKHGKVSLPSLHRHVILDSWLKPKITQVLGSRLDKMMENFSAQELAKHKVGHVLGNCQECKKEQLGGWLDPDVEEFFCEDCWRVFSPKVLKCGFCNGFQPWPLGRVETVTRMWHCIDCLLQMGIDID